MLLPLVSVSLIGLLVGGAFALSHPHRVTLILWSLLGAWGGFLLGALAGVMIDVIAGTGVWLALIGHLTALLVAVATAQRATEHSHRRAA
ncbi:MAG: hypothetical protein WA892_04720 [Ornithinimicrobium sp.]